MANETIEWDSDFPLKDNPSALDAVMIMDKSTGKPAKVTFESLQANAAANVIGSMTPDGSPSGSETNGQSYRVSNTTGAEVTYTNFLTNVPDGSGGFLPVQMEADERSGYLIKNADGWAYVDNSAEMDTSDLMKNGGYEGTGKDLKDAIGALSDDQVKNYQLKYLVPDVDIPSITVGGVVLTDPIEKKRILIKLETSITRFETFNHLPGMFFILSQFAFNPGENISIGISRSTSETEEVAFSAAKLFQSITLPGSAKFTLDYGTAGQPYNIFIDIDVNVLGDQSISLNSQHSSNVSYKWAGIVTQLIKDTYQIKDYWGFGFSQSPVVANRPDNINVYDAIKSIVIKSNDSGNDRLLLIRQFGYDTTPFILMWSCLDNDPNNMEITTSRAGFRYYRIKLSVTDTGLKRYESYAASGTGDPEIQVSMVIDMDRFFEGISDKTSLRVQTNKDTAQFLVKKKIASSGGGGHFTQLDLISDEDFDNGTFAFQGESTSWGAGVGNATKLVKIPEGTTSIDITASLNGTSFNLLVMDKDMFFLEWGYDGSSGTITSLNYVPHPDAVFVKLISSTAKGSIKIKANGDFNIDPTTVKEYRSIHTGLADKFSGWVISVAGNLFKKSKSGICDITEYVPSIPDLIDIIPNLTTDGVLKVPTGILATNGATYAGGALCSVKNGVMYFRNENFQSVFKSEDGGETYTTLFDKFSHPDIFNVANPSQNNGRPSVIPLDNGELLIPIMSSIDELVSPEKTYKKTFYKMFRTTGGQSDLVPCFPFSYENTLIDWVDPSATNYKWANYVTGCILSDFSYSVNGNIVAITEYGVNTPRYWAEQGISKNGNGVVGRAWISFDYGVTFKKMFDADRKISGTDVNDGNWYYWRDTFNRMQCHIHGISVEPARDIVTITNGDGDDFIWELPLSDIKTWFDSAPAVSPTDKPEYTETDTFPEWEQKQVCWEHEQKINSFASYSYMHAQLMKSIETGMGLVWGHDSPREFAYITYKNNGETIFEPSFKFEQDSDYANQTEKIQSWNSTDGFVQGMVKHDGVIYFTHSNGGTRPARIWASVDGIYWKIAYQGANSMVGFGTKLIFDKDKVYLTNPVGKPATGDGFYVMTKS